MTKKEFNEIREQRSLKRLDIVYRYNQELIKFDAESIRLLEVTKSKESMRAHQPRN